MNELKPINQTKLYGLNKFLEKFIKLYEDKDFLIKYCYLVKEE